MEDDLHIPYDLLVESALRSVVRGALALVIDNGLPGGHHFYITFRTDHPDAIVPPRLKAQHPESMTIILQHQFWNLVIEQDYFSIDLSFQGKIETLRVPFGAIADFADPFAKFMLHFQPSLNGEDADEEQTEENANALPQDMRSDMDSDAELPEENKRNENTEQKQESSNVVKLDRFRKK